MSKELKLLKKYETLFKALGLRIFKWKFGVLSKLTAIFVLPASICYVIFGGTDEIIPNNIELRLLDEFLLVVNHILLGVFLIALFGSGLRSQSSWENIAKSLNIFDADHSVQANINRNEYARFYILIVLPSLFVISDFIS